MKILRRWGAHHTLLLLREKLGKTFNLPHLTKRIDEEYLCNLIESIGFVIKPTKEHWIVSKPGSPDSIICRKFSSDLAVFKQIMVADDLGVLFKKIRQNKIQLNTIIDAGSNIGLVAFKIKEAFPTAKIFCVEPDKENFRVLEENLRNGNINALAINAGIWHEPKRLYFDRTFRDSRHWSIALTEESISDDFIEALSLNSLLSTYKIEVLDLLKIDIEGGERYIFNEEEKGLEFLDRTKILAVEIHEEFNIKERIVHILKRRGFDIDQSGEYLIGYNRQLLGR